MIKSFKDVLKCLGIVFLYFILTFSYVFIANIFDINLKTASNNTLTILLLSTELIMIIVFSIIYRKSLLKDFKSFRLGDTIRNNYKYYLLGLLLMLIINYILVFGLNINMAQNELTNRVVLNKLPLYTYIACIFCAPFVEEIVFKLNFNKLIKNDFLYVVVTSLIFGSIHVVFSFNSPLELLFILSYATLGSALALIYRKSNNIFSSMLFHSIHNALCIILILI